MGLSRSRLDASQHASVFIKVITNAPQFAPQGPCWCNCVTAAFNNTSEQSSSVGRHAEAVVRTPFGAKTAKTNLDQIDPKSSCSRRKRTDAKNKKRWPTKRPTTPPPPPATGGGQQVSSLVSAMQSGEISKAELFASLSELKRTPRSPRAGAGDVQRLVGAMRAGKLNSKESSWRL